MTDVDALVRSALEELNLQLPPEQRFPIGPDTSLFAPGGHIDSFGLVNLILLLEERVFDSSGLEITLSDDRILAEPESPFRDVRSLTEHVRELIDRRSLQPDQGQGA